MATITEHDVLSALIECSGHPDNPVPAVGLHSVTFAELGYDSLALIETAARLEEQFGVRIADEDLPRLTTFGQLVECANG